MSGHKKANKCNDARVLRAKPEQRVHGTGQGNPECRIATTQWKDVGHRIVNEHDAKPGTEGAKNISGNKAGVVRMTTPGVSVFATGLCGDRADGGKCDWFHGESAAWRQARNDHCLH